jgi:hypothetical protein
MVHIGQQELFPQQVSFKYNLLGPTSTPLLLHIGQQELFPQLVGL